MHRIVVLGTGGTIARSKKGHVSAKHLIKDYPRVQLIARDLMRISGTDMSESDVLAVANATRDAFRRQGATAVIVTCGTDALEELAWAIGLCRVPSGPVVVTGAMLRRNEKNFDGARNVASALRVAMTRRAANYGTLVVMRDRIYEPSTVAKWRFSGPDAFEGLSRAVGVVGKKVTFLRPPRPLPIVPFRRFGRVPIMHLHTGIRPEEIMWATSEVDGVVVVGFGPGRIPRVLWSRLKQLARRVPVAVVPGVADATSQAYRLWPGRREVEAL